VDNLWFAIWFFLPAGIANATPVLANKVPLLTRWKTPLDFGKHYRGKRIFGVNKSWRGLVFSSFVAGLVSLATYALYDQYFVILGLSPQQPALYAFFIGLLLGAGALLGDAIESFFKRQLGRNPGTSWFPFDQIDYIIGAMIAVSPLVALSVTQATWILFVWFFSHLFWAYIAYLLKLKDTPI
jgi:CDP-2,3-bis-(O-geranylgeranyl)-sn-glycerol synthase